MPYKGWLSLGVVFFVVTIATAVPQVLDSVPFLPQYEYGPKPVERLSELSQGQYKFVNYNVVKSSEITSGSHVRGNVTFWYLTSYQLPYVRVLTEADYKRGSPADIDNLNVARLSDLGRCCVILPHFGYTVAFNFTSEETTSYYFLFEIGLSGANDVTVDILTEERVSALWKTIVPWVSAFLTVVTAALGFYKKNEEHGI